MKQKRFTISLDEDMYTILSEQAKRDRRTLGQEIAHLLELYVPAYKRTVDNMLASNGLRSPENPTGQSYTPTANIDSKPKQYIM